MLNSRVERQNGERYRLGKRLGGRAGMVSRPGPLLKPAVGLFQRQTAALALGPTVPISELFLLCGHREPSPSGLRDISRDGRGGTSEAESRAARALLGRETASFRGGTRAGFVTFQRDLKRES